MREGPLADLFRSTGRDEPDEETRVTGDREASASVPEPPEPEIPEPRPQATPPDPERVRAYRVEEREHLVREPKERLSRIFADEAHDVEGPTYGGTSPRWATTTGRPVHTCP
jgi:hypothetical protein